MEFIAGDFVPSKARNNNKNKKLRAQQLHASYLLDYFIYGIGLIGIKTCTVSPTIIFNGQLNV